MVGSLWRRLSGGKRPRPSARRELVEAPYWPRGLGRQLHGCERCRATHCFKKGYCVLVEVEGPPRRRWPHQRSPKSRMRACQHYYDRRLCLGLVHDGQRRDKLGRLEARAITSCMFVVPGRRVRFSCRSQALEWLSLYIGVVIDMLGQPKAVCPEGDLPLAKLYKARPSAA